MSFSPETHVPSPPTITVDTLRRLLADLPPEWQVLADGAHQFLIGRGYFKVPDGHITLVDELPE